VCTVDAAGQRQTDHVSSQIIANFLWSTHLFVKLNLAFKKVLNQPMIHRKCYDNKFKYGKATLSSKTPRVV
jgi:hypothetical protein